MFKKRRAIQVQMVKTSKKQTDTDETQMCNHKDPEEIAEIAKDFVKHVGIVVGVVFAASAVTSAICQIAVEKNKKEED